MKIVFIGDIVAEPGRKAVRAFLPKLKQEHRPDVVIANVENIAHGRGVSAEYLKEMHDAGIDFFTSGDHVFWQKDTEDVIEQETIIRPANYPAKVPGIGHHLLDLGAKGNLLVINLMGRTFLNERLNDPFTTADAILDYYKDGDVKHTIVDFHAEATSEKYAMGFYLDGRVDVVVGTHTHVPTCDGFIMPKGTMYISDAGMTGNIDSILGVKKEIIIDLYLTAQNQRFDWEDKGRKAFRSVLFNTDTKEITRLDYII